MNEASGEVWNFHCGGFLPRAPACIWERHVRLSVTANSSLSFEAKKLKFCIKTSHIDAKKGTKRELKFCFGAEL